MDDDDDLRNTLANRFQRQGMQVSSCATAGDAIAMSPTTPWDVALLDLHLPDMAGIDLLPRLKQVQPQLEAIMLTAHGSVETAVQAMKRGAYDYITKPFRLPELDVHLNKALEKVQLSRRERQWVEQLRHETPRHRLVGSSPGIRRIAQLIERVAPTNTTVLLRGPSGSGKEVVARTLHASSRRNDRPMVTVNCASLQESMLESELFGHERHAASGPPQIKTGIVETAEGSTLFIDEIAEMAAGLQAKLLRVLEDGSYRRIDSAQELRADVRIIAATNRPLEDAIRSGAFREDLFYRLNVMTMTLPALRERKEDIPELVEYFLSTRRIGARQFGVEPSAMEALTAYDWPGNVRELANVLERAQILATDENLTLVDLPENLTEGRVFVAADGARESKTDLHAAQRRHVVEVLAQHKGNKVHAAKALGISRRALYRLLEKYGVDGR